MAYKITKDYVNAKEPTNEVGKGRFRKRDENGKIIKELTEEEMPYKFRLKDDDGEVYFEGISNDNNSEKAFLPLDSIGASYGCTMIEYKNGNKWELL